MGGFLLVDLVMAAAHHLDPRANGLIGQRLTAEEHCNSIIGPVEEEAVRDTAPGRLLVQTDGNGSPVVRDEIDRSGHSLTRRAVGIHPHPATVLDG